MAAQAKKVFLVESCLLLGCTCGKRQQCSALLPTLQCCPSATLLPWQDIPGPPAEIRLGIPWGFLWGMA